MNQLRQLMLEELHRRNFAATTIRTYLHGVEHFSRYFRRPPDQLGPEDIRKYQAMLFTKLKFSPNTVILRLASLRFFYIHVLKRNWSIAETPLSEEAASPSRGAQSGRGCAADRRRGHTLSSHPADDYVCHRRTPRRSSSPEGERHRQQADGGSYPRGQGRQGPRCHAQPEAARRTARLLARPPAQAEGVAVSGQPLAHIESSSDHQGPVVCLPDRCRTRWPRQQAHSSPHVAPLLRHTPS